MRLREAIMSETERELVRKEREIAKENARIFSTLKRVDKNTLPPQINGSHQQDSSSLRVAFLR